MPDTVVLFFTYNRQSMKGVEGVAKSILAQDDKDITILPVAMRAERSVKGYERANRIARELLSPLLQTQFDRDSLERYLEAYEVPSYPDYAFEETLAVFKDLPEQRNTLLRDMMWLATAIQGSTTSLAIPDPETELREKYLERFAGARPLNEAKLLLLGR